jgi:signal transduction histidine kinase
MPSDSQFIDNYIAAVQEEQDSSAHDAWVQERLALDFMHSAKVAMRSGILVIALTFAVLIGYVNMLALGAWALISLLLMGFRWYLIREFQRMVQLQATQQQTADITGFFRRYGWSWPLSAMMLAFPVFLYYEKTPAETQYLCLMMMVAIGAIGASMMSAHLQCQRLFSHALAGTIGLAIVWNWLHPIPMLPSRESIIFMLLVLLGWVLVVYLGKTLHKLQRSGYSAQFGNEQLIRSLRQQTQSATEAVQMKNNLLASAAHDLRQPVHALAFYADWLRHEPHMSSSILPKILVATDSVNTLFNSLFDFARIESGAVKVNLGDIDIEQLIEELAVEFAPAADKKGLYLRAQSVPAVARSDSVLLRRITSNLLANAIRYTEKGGVMITARVVGNKLWLEIVDSGVGIAPEHLPHVFKDFYRAPVHEGTADSFGLGLAIVQRLCRLLGHVVSIRSQLGKGTHGKIEITLDERAQQDTSAPMPLDEAQKLYDQIMPRERAQ